MTISIIKTKRDGSPQNWGEHLLVGVLAGIACTGLSVVTWFLEAIFRLPESLVLPQIFVVGVVSAMIGLLGSSRITRKLEDYAANAKEDTNDTNK